MPNSALRTSFTTSARRASMLALLLVAVAACSDASAPREDALAAGPAKTAAPTTGDALIRGIVLGVDSAGGRPWSAHPIAGASVTALHVWKQPSAGSDSSTAPPVLTTIGSATSGADGSFELSRVPSGYYYLDVVPPASSGYRSARAGSVSFPEGSADKAFVYLYR